MRIWGIPILHLISVNKASMVREYTCQWYYDCSVANAAVLWPASLWAKSQVYKTQLSLGFAILRCLDKKSGGFPVMVMNPMGKKVKNKSPSANPSSK